MQDFKPTCLAYKNHFTPEQLNGKKVTYGHQVTDSKISEEAK